MIFGSSKGFYLDNVYDALGYCEAISYQVKMMMNNSPLIKGKNDY